MTKTRDNTKYINYYKAVIAAILLLCTVFSIGFSVYPTYAAETETNEHGFAGGNGSGGDPFLIATPAQLDNVRNFASNILDIGSGYPYRSYHFKVICDIDMEAYLAKGGEGYAQWGTSGWLPIEKEGMFNGVFDGGFYTVKNLWSYRPDDSNIGLFGYCEDSLIKNINLELSDKGITGFSFVGGIAARIYNGKTDVEGARITGCSVTGNVSAASGPDDWPVMSYAGGIVGDITNGAVMECVFSGSVSGLCAVGGIAGVNVRGKISDCLSYGKVVLTSTEDFIPEAGAGGIVGITMDNETIIKNCFYDAPQIDFRIAAIVGFRTTIYRKSEYNGLPSVSGCYYNGSVFSGSLTLIEDTEILDEAAGCDGWYSVKIDEENFEWLYDESLISEVWVKFTPINSRALIAAELKNKSNFTGWDFETVWGFDKKHNLVLRAFGNHYDPPSLTWLWITLGCGVFGAAAIAGGIILYRRKKTEIVKEQVIVNNFINVEKAVPINQGLPLPMELFTPAERRVAPLLALGKSRREIAQILNLAENTVKVHTRNIFDKVEAKNQTAFIARYIYDDEYFDED